MDRLEVIAVFRITAVLKDRLVQSRAVVIRVHAIAIRGFAVSIGQCAIGHFAWNKRHDSRFFDAVVGQRVEFLPAVDELRGGVFVRQDDGTSAKLTPFEIDFVDGWAKGEGRVAIKGVQNFVFDLAD